MRLSSTLCTSSIDPLIETSIVSLLIMECAVCTSLIHVSVVLVDRVAVVLMSLLV